MPHNLNRIALAAGLMVALVIATATTPSAHAARSSGPNNGLCSPQSNRLSIAKDFVLDACFDGQNLYLVNNTDFPLDVQGDGPVGQPYQSAVGGIPAIPSFVLTYIHPADPGLIMPGYQLRIPIGSGPADISVHGNNNYRTYVLLRFLFTWLPTNDFLQVAQQVPQLTYELSSVSAQYQDCLSRHGFFGKLGCDALYYRNVAFAAGRFLVHSLASGLLGGLLNLLDTAEWGAKSPSEYLALLHGTKTLYINPAAAVTPVPTVLPATPPPAPQPTPPSAPQPTPTLPPQPTPTPSQTYAETTGGDAHTWTNYTNAGGYEGPTIPSNATVQIACKITGFVVADGNPWWYRIASSPWNNAYYVSADAFYNNGQTSGSLHGTPFVDPNVPNC